MTFDLSGKVALVTGGGTEIGRALAGALTRHGAQTFIVGRREDVLRSAAAEIGAVALVADIRTDGLDNVYREIAAHAGHIDILVANAGTTRSIMLAESSEVDFEEIIGLNVRALYFTVAKAVLLLADGASVVLLGSASAPFGANRQPAPGD